MSDKKRKRTKNGRRKRGFPLALCFTTISLWRFFACCQALLLWFSMAFTNTEEFPVAIRDVPVTIKIPEAAQAEGLQVFSPTGSTVLRFISRATVFPCAM